MSSSEEMIEELSNKIEQKELQLEMMKQSLQSLQKTISDHETAMEVMEQLDLEQRTELQFYRREVEKFDMQMDEKANELSRLSAKYSEAAHQAELFKW